VVAGSCAESVLRGEPAVLDGGVVDDAYHQGDTDQPDGDAQAVEGGVGGWPGPQEIHHHGAGPDDGDEIDGRPHRPRLNDLRCVGQPRVRAMSTMIITAK
jgi:hypothetical protein